MQFSIFLERLDAFSARLVRLSRPAKRRLEAAADFFLISLSVYLAYVLRMETWIPRDPTHMTIAALTASAVAVAVFERLGLYKALVRFMGNSQIPAMLGGIGAAIAALAFSGWVLELFVPRSVPPLFAIIAVLLIAGLRLTARQFLMRSENANRIRVAIYGAGSAGRQLASALRSGNQYSPLFFVDDNKALRRSSVMGLPIFEPGLLPRLVSEYDIQRVLFAVPSADPQKRRQILNTIISLPVPVLTVPGISDLVSGRRPISSLHEVDSGDLLGRTPVASSAEELDANIRGKVVMVTGAGGSIGSELCRLIISRRAKILVLFEASEFALYSIKAELDALMATMGTVTSLHSVLGSVRDKDRVLAAIREFGIMTIYHAAAYKHVPLVEQNPSEGVLNNTFGTVATAIAAVEGAVQTFVFISTDKAVRPTSIMGASKRLAELVCQDLSQRQTGTRFAMVRFGNVLDSSGSVVPLFRQQIERGGPVTVTHPEVTRYFMTIRESAELVIQAGAMAEGGEVFVLDMGNMVRIADLARSMIRLAGRSIKDKSHPDGDIEIVYTGLRQGEKLYEELLIGEGVFPTRHPLIRACRETFLETQDLSRILDDLKQVCANGNSGEIRDFFRKLPVHYQSSPVQNYDYRGSFET